MIKASTYRLEPFGFEEVRSDGFLYVDAIKYPQDPIAKRGAWFLEKFAKESGLEPPEALLNKLNNPSETDIVVASRLVEPTVHTGMNWRSEKDFGSSIKGINRYIGFGFGSRARAESDAGLVETIIVDPSLILIHGLVREAIRIVMLEEADVRPETSRLSPIEVSSAIRLKSVQKTSRE